MKKKQKIYSFSTTDRLLFLLKETGYVDGRTFNLFKDRKLSPLINEVLGDYLEERWKKLNPNLSIEERRLRFERNQISEEISELELKGRILGKQILKYKGGE